MIHEGWMSHYATPALGVLDRLKRTWKMIARRIVGAPLLAGNGSRRERAVRA
jgi:hypothetical protein